MRHHAIIGMLLALALGATASASEAQERGQAEVQLQAALHAEEVQGDLARAITLYKDIVTKYAGEREVAARALLYLGRSYEKLGSQEATSAYQRVVREYGEQSEVAAQARARLASLTQQLAELRRRPTFRKIEIASKPQGGVLSPDGNKLAFISDGGLWVVPIHGKVNPDIAGEPVRLADVPDVWDNGSLMSWSAGGQWIAVNSTREDEDSVYIIPASGGEPRRVEVPDRGGHAWSHRLSLSPDGRTLAFSALDLGTREEVPEGLHRYVYTIPTAGGEPKRVSSDWGRLPSYSPDGKLIAYVGYRERNDWSENAERWRFDGDLWVASSGGGNAVRLATVDGQLRGPVWSPDGAYIAAHHEPGTTNSSKEIWVFPLSADVSSAGEPTKIALPRESWDMIAGWTPDGELGVFVQSELHEAIYTVPASGGKAVQITPEMQWPYYPRWSPDGERIYVRAVRGDEKHRRITIEYVSAAGGEPIEVHVSAERPLVSIVPGGGLNVSPQGDRVVVSAYQEPYDPKGGADLWTIPVNGGRPVRLTSDGSMEGYPCWSPDGRWVAFTDYKQKSDDEEFSAIYVVPSEGGDIRQITAEADSVGGGAIAFSPDGKRIAFFSGGAIKTIPVQGGQAEVLVAGVRSSRHSQLEWSPDGLRIAHNVGGKIWITPLNGGASEALRKGLTDGADLSEFGWSPDGKKIVFMASIGGDLEFWLISDFLPKGR